MPLISKISVSAALCVLCSMNVNINLEINAHVLKFLKQLFLQINIICP